MYLAQRKQSKSMCRYTRIYYIRPSTAVSLRPFMSVFKTTTVRYGYPYSITV